MNQVFTHTLLMTPGPVPLHPDIQNELALPMIHHRTPAFDQILQETLSQLKTLFQTQQPCFCLTSTGSGGMEALLINVLHPQARVLCVDSGKFGERWAEMVTVFGGQLTRLKVPWGEAVDLSILADYLQQNSFDIIMTQACETSTGVLHPLSAMSQLIQRYQPHSLFLVDAITALGAVDIPMDAWNIDGLVGGSQKAFMLPTGLSLLSFSAKAWQVIHNNPTPRYYFDIRKELKANQSGQTFFSSNVLLIRALNMSLKKMFQSGLDHHFQQIKDRSDFTQSFAQLLGLKSYSQSLSPSISALVTPVDSQKLRDLLEEKYLLVVMGGQDQAKGQIIRIGHMGHIQPQDLISMAQRLYAALKEMGHPVPEPQLIENFYNKWNFIT